MVHAPYGLCEKHDLPLEVLFHTPFCPLCEDLKREAIARDKENKCSCGNKCGDKCKGSCGTGGPAGGCGGCGGACADCDETDVDEAPDWNWPWS